MTPGSTSEDLYRSCICLGLCRAARSVSRRYDAALRDVGLSSGQFSLLSALQRTTSATIGELADLLDMDRTTLSRNLKPLAAARLVRDQLDPDDRRVHRLSLTTTGLNRLELAIPAWRAAQRDTTSRLGDTRWSELRPTLHALAK